LPKDLVVCYEHHRAVSVALHHTQAHVGVVDRFEQLHGFDASSPLFFLLSLVLLRGTDQVHHVDVLFPFFEEALRVAQPHLPPRMMKGQRLYYALVESEHMVAFVGVLELVQ